MPCDPRGRAALSVRQDVETAIQNAGTWEYDVLAWKAKTGVLKGAYIPLATAPLEESDQVLNILATSVIGSIAEHVLTGGTASTTARVAVAPLAVEPAWIIESMLTKDGGFDAMKRLLSSERRPTAVVASTTSWQSARCWRSHDRG